MSTLSRVIAEHIRTHGPMTIADYMTFALQHPDHGYYRKGDPLGKDGDFTTSPEISQMFGEMIGLWCAEVWRMMGSPKPFTLMEMGPGRGTLMQDALRATAKISGFHDAMFLCLLETSETLRAKQEEKLANYTPHYIDDVVQVPAQPAIVISNEFFDALPIHQFEKTFNGWQERYVGLDGDKFVFTHVPLNDVKLQFIPERLKDAVVGTVFELCPTAAVIMRKLARLVRRRGGAVLTLDYGYPESAGAPTWQAVAKHTFANVLDNPGEIDLTAHVDFGALHRAALSEGSFATHILTQGDFLTGMGMELRATQLKRVATPEQAAAIDIAYKRLTDQAEMGTLFKVMAASVPTLTELPGF